MVVVRYAAASPCHVSLRSMGVVVMSSGNQLMSLRDSFANLTQLTLLLLTYVLLSSSPCRHTMRWVCCMRVIAVYRCNPLTSLPDWFGNLTQLTELNLLCTSPSFSSPRLRVTRCLR